MSGCVLDIAGSSVFAKIARVPDAGRGTTQAIFQARYDQNNYFSIGCGNSYLFAQINSAGSLLTHATDIKASRYWRIREGSTVGALKSIGYVNFNGVSGVIGNAYAEGSSPSDFQGVGDITAGTTTGDAVIMVITSSGASTVTVSDTSGNPWFLVSSVTLGTGQVQYVFLASSAISLSSVSSAVYIDSDTFINFSATLFYASGYFDVDVNNSATGNSSAPSVATGTMSLPNELEVVVFSNGGSVDTNSLPSGWSNAVTLNNTNGFSFYPGTNIVNHVFYKKATSTVSDTCTSSYAISHQWGGIAFTLKPRIDTGNVFFDYSTDGSSWTNFWSSAHSLASKLQLMRVYFNSGYYGTEYDPGPFLIGGIGVV
jgi:hypothetical protein